MNSDEEIVAILGGTRDTKEHLHELTKQLGTRSGVLPFVGAGLSMPLGFPGWDKFLRELGERAGVLAQVAEFLSDSKYEEAAALVKQELGPRHFQDLLANRFGDHVIGDKLISGPVAELPHFPDGPIITTNFDRVLENVFQQAKKTLKPVWHSQASKGSQALQQDKPFLLKLHGDWEDVDTRVLTLDEYERAYGDKAGRDIEFTLPIPRLLFTLLSSRTCLFIGCSLRQDRTVQTLKAIALGISDLAHYAVVEEPSSADDLRTRAAELSIQSIRPIWYPHGRHELIQPILSYLAKKAGESLQANACQMLAATPRRIDVPNNIPSSPAEKIIGRESELQQIADMLRAAQLVTILGVGGCGKSRLAIEVAHAIKGQYESGVWFVPLADLAAKADKEQVLPTRIGRIVGVPEQAGRPPNEALVEHLRAGKFLLVLDNCEHLIRSCREVVGYLLQNCPELTVLATSRRPIKLVDHNERIYPLAPLQVPDETVQSLDEVRQNPSVMLFVERASKRAPTYKLNTENFCDVAKLCRALEGIPLAIEVAAARLGVKTVEQMNQESRALLTTIGNIRNGDLRPWKTLTAALRWSYGLLTHHQQVFMRSLSAFDGGWTEKAAEAVYRRPESDPVSVLDHLQALYDSSLVVTNGGKGAKRFRFLEPIRQMVQLQLTAEERMKCESRHASYFLSLSEEAAPDLLTERQKLWLDILQAEADNLRASIRWSIATGDAETGLRLIAALWRFTEIRGNFVEGRDRAEEVLKIPQTERFPQLRSTVLSGAGMLAYRQAKFDKAEDMFAASLKIEESLADGPGIPNALNDLGNVARMKGDYGRAGELYLRCLEIERGSGNQRGIAVVRFNLGCLSLTKGKNEEAEQYFDESLKGFQDGGNERECGFPLNGLSQVFLATGDLQMAEEYGLKSFAIRRKLNDAKGRADSLGTLGFISIEAGDLVKARDFLADSILLAQGLIDDRGVSEALDLFGILSGRANNAARAVEVFAASEKIRGKFTYSPPKLRLTRRQESLERAKTSLGEQMYSRAWRRGTLLKVGEAIELVADKKRGDAV